MACTAPSDQQFLVPGSCPFDSEAHG